MHATPSHRAEGKSRRGALCSLALAGATSAALLGHASVESAGAAEHRWTSNAPSLGADATMPSSLQVLYAFRGGADGAKPYAGLLAGPNGSLFGTTSHGGGGCASTDGCGTAFELTPSQSGGYVESIIHRFDGNGDPVGVFFPFTGGKDGALYSASASGGDTGNGSVYALTPSSAGYSVRVLFSFVPSIGYSPRGGVVLDRKGALYGATGFGGSGAGFGTIYRVSLAYPGYSILHYFKGLTAGDGAYPAAGLTADADGNLFGTTENGGQPDDAGTVFELSPTGRSYTVLYSFTSQYSPYVDGECPTDEVIIDKAGNIYGTTLIGGFFRHGTVFELARVHGGYRERVLYSFRGVTDGANPIAALTFGPHGVLYGTTSGGGFLGFGTVFELVPSGAHYVEKVLHAFQYSDGSMPRGKLILDASGALYGTTEYGGPSDDGVVFKLTL